MACGFPACGASRGIITGGSDGTSEKSVLSLGLDTSILLACGLWLDARPPKKKKNGKGVHLCIEHFPRECFCLSVFLVEVDAFEYDVGG